MSVLHADDRVPSIVTGSSQSSRRRLKRTVRGWSVAEPVGRSAGVALIAPRREQSRARAACSLLLPAKAEASERSAGRFESVEFVEKQK